MKKYYFFLLTAVLLSACSKSIYNPKSPDYSPVVEIQTEFGNMEIVLYSTTPLHRDNFVKLVKEGFYDSLLFHRVINNFMIQGGNPQSKNAKPGIMLGNGGPGYTVPAEFVDTLLHYKGVLSAARMGDQVNPKKESSGSQFYIVQGQKVSTAIMQQMQARNGNKYTEEQQKKYAETGGTPHLDGSYTVFGEVIRGLEVLDKIAVVQCNGANRPIKDILMKVKMKKR